MHPYSQCHAKHFDVLLLGGWVGFEKTCPTFCWAKRQHLQRLGGNRKYVWFASFWDKKLGAGGWADKEIPVIFILFFVRDDYD